MTWADEVKGRTEMRSTDSPEHSHLLQNLPQVLNRKNFVLTKLDMQTSFKNRGVPNDHLNMISIANLPCVRERL